MHRRRSVSAPLILVAPLSLPLPLSTSHSFASFCISQYLALHSSLFTGLPFVIFHLTASLLSHSFHILSSAECAELPAEKARVHIISPSLSPPQTSEQLHFSPQRIPPQLVSWSLLQFSLDPSLLDSKDSSPPNCTCLLSTDQCHQCQ